MNWATNGAVSLLWFLLPGFVAAWVFNGLTAYPKRTEFERLVQALILTAFAQAATYLLKLLLFQVGARGWSVGVWTSEVERFWSILVAIGIGVFFAWAANGDGAHRALRAMGITRQTGYPSEWFGAFNERGKTHVVLHLTGERRLYGWPQEWPLDSRGGHFAMVDAEWLEAEESIPLAGVSQILVPATEVTFVEFMQAPSPTGSANGGSNGTETAAATTEPPG